MQQQQDVTQMKTQELEDERDHLLSMPVSPEFRADTRKRFNDIEQELEARHYGEHWEPSS